MLEKYLKLERKINRNKKYLKKIEYVYAHRKWSVFDRKKKLTILSFFVSVIIMLCLDDGFISNVISLVPCSIFVIFIFYFIGDIILIIKWNEKEKRKKDENNSISIKIKKILEKNTEQLFTELKAKREYCVIKRDDLEASKKILLRYNKKLNMLNKKDEIDTLFDSIEVKNKNDVSIENI